MLEGTDWELMLFDEFNSTYMKDIGKKLYEARQKRIVYPESSRYFQALKECNYSKVKVVIMTTEPYCTGESDGLGFGTNEDVIKLPETIETIFKAIEESVYKGLRVEQNPQLSRLAQQGVLLLNVYLSVEKGFVESHSDIGWERFTSKLISLLSAKKEPIVFILMGQKAKLNEKLIKNHHLVIPLEHPLVSCYNERPWDYKDCFNKANSFLTDNNQLAIAW